MITYEVESESLSLGRGEKFKLSIRLIESQCNVDLVMLMPM